MSMKIVVQIYTREPSDDEIGHKRLDNTDGELSSHAIPQLA